MTEQRSLVANLVPELDQQSLNDIIAQLQKDLSFTADITATATTTAQDNANVAGEGASALQEVLDQTQDAMNTVSEVLGETTAELGDTLSETMTETSEEMGDALKGITDELGDAMAETSDAMSDMMEGFSDGLEDIAEEMGEGNENSKSALSTITSSVGTIADIGLGALRSIMDIVSSAWKRLQDASPLLKETMGLINNAINLILMPIGTAFAIELIPLVRELYEFIGELVQTMWDAYEDGGISSMIAVGISEGIPALLEFAKEALMLIPDDIPVISDIRDFAVWTLDWLEDNADVLINTMNAVLSAVKIVGDNLGTVVTLFGTFLGLYVAYKLIESSTGIWGDIFSPAEGAATAAVTALVVGGVGGTLLGAGTAYGLGMFASGGYVTRPTFATVAEEEPEYIIPESKVSGFISANSRGMGGSTYTLNFYGYNDDEFVRRVEDVVNRNSTLASLRGGF